MLYDNSNSMKVIPTGNKTPALQLAKQEQDKIIQELALTIEALETRLSALMVQSPNKDPRGISPPSGGSQLTMGIQQNNEMLHNNLLRLRGIIESLDV